MTRTIADEPRQNEETQPAEPPLSEPSIIPVLSVSDFAIEAGPNVARFIGWVTTPRLENEESERRITVRFDMPVDAIRPLRDKLSKAIPKGH